MNKKGQVLMVLGVIVLVAVVCIAVIAGVYNSLVSKDTNVQAKWGNVQSAYQRRADLIPNLVATVQGSANFESKTQTEIASLRSGAEQVSKDVATATTPEQLQSAQTQMTGLIGRLNVVVEAYPQLNSVQAFRDLQVQLEGTENRIQFERNNYNTAVQTYGTAVRSFPTNIFANMFGFSIDKWKTFQADETAQSSPKVNFTMNN